MNSFPIGVNVLYVRIQIGIGHTRTVRLLNISKQDDECLLHLTLYRFTNDMTKFSVYQPLHLIVLEILRLDIYVVHLYSEMELICSVYYFMMH